MNIFPKGSQSGPQSWWVFLLALALTLSGGVASAQSDDEEIADEVVEASDEDEVDASSEPAPMEEVVTTGSRIVRDTFSSISPLQVIDGETSRDLGLVDTSELLRQATVVQGQQITTGISTSAGLLTDNGPGSASATLRGLIRGVRSLWSTDAAWRLLVWAVHRVIRTSTWYPAR